MIRSLNNTLGDIYADDAIAMADVATQFSLYDAGSLRLPGKGRVSGEVARTCALTWMCPRNGMKPNIHPDDAGSLEIAQAIDAVVPANLCANHRVRVDRIEDHAEAASANAHRRPPAPRGRARGTNEKLVQGQLDDARLTARGRTQASDVAADARGTPSYGS